MISTPARPPVTPFYIIARDRWRIMPTGPDGKRYSKTFRTKAEAIASAIP